MNPGKMDRRIRFIATDIEIENELGELENGEQFIAEVWAQVLEIKGRERYKLGKIDAELDYEIVCRYRSDINQTMEIEYKNRRLEILSVVELGRREFLEIIAREKVTDHGRYPSKRS